MITSAKEKMVLDKIAQLVSVGSDYHQAALEQTQKRLTWYESVKDLLDLKGPLPRQAFTLVILKSMGIVPSDAPVISESETSITWHSFNFCPVLEACK